MPNGSSFLGIDWIYLIITVQARTNALIVIDCHRIVTCLSGVPVFQDSIIIYVDAYQFVHFQHKLQLFFALNYATNGSFSNGVST